MEVLIEGRRSFGDSSAVGLGMLSILSAGRSGCSSLTLFVEGCRRCFLNVLGDFPPSCSFDTVGVSAESAKRPLFLLPQEP